MGFHDEFVIPWVNGLSEQQQLYWAWCFRYLAGEVTAGFHNGKLASGIPETHGTLRCVGRAVQDRHCEVPV